MRVAYFALAPFISGSERSLQLLILHSKEKGIIPILVSPPDSPMHNWARENQIPSFECHLGIFSLKHPLLWLISRLKLILILKKNKIQIVHSNQIWSLPAAQIPSKVLNLKRVCHFRDPVNKEINWWLKGGLDCAISISKHIDRQIEKHIQPQLINARETIINPINLDTGFDYSMSHTIKMEARKCLNLPLNTKIFGYIGQVTPVKGVTNIIKAFSALPDSLQPMLLIAGDDTTEGKRYLADCKQLIDELNIENRVIFLGFMGDVRNFYNSVDVVVVHSKEEPLGRTPLEAGSYYKPTIATNVGGLPETILHNKTGWLVNPELPEETISAMKFCLSNDISNFGISARNYVEEIAHPGRYADKIISIYKKLIKGY
ncbi:MAG: glycosyltransferase [Gammaproteobacteria bacterium]|nr:glycosyltransferase [Gammaproteobacteria bacterium]